VVNKQVGLRVWFEMNGTCVVSTPLALLCSFKGMAPEVAAAIAAREEQAR
jgi:hypothetical protein